MSQGKSLYMYLKQAKVSFFFFFTKMENRRAEQALFGGLVPVRREDVGKGFRSVNIVHMVDTLCKMEK
jgi:hypothetical protein